MPSARFIPIPGTPPAQSQPDARFRPLGAPVPPPPTQALGGSTAPRFTPVPRQQTPGLPGQPGGGQGSAIPGAIGTALGGLGAGVQGLQFANQASGGALGNLLPLQQGIGGLTGLFGLAQGIRNDNPISAIGGGLQAAESLSGLAGGPTLSSLAGSAGAYVAPGIGALLGILQNALSGKMDQQEQAFRAALLAGSAAAAPATAGISLLAPVIMELGGPLFGETPSVYDAKRSIAGQQGLNALKNYTGALGGNLQQFLQTGDLTHALSGLKAGFGGASGNSLRSELNLPAPVATALGFPKGQIQWNQLNPQQFTQVLQTMAAQPDQGVSWIAGSGDIPYMNQATAERFAAEAGGQTRDYLHAVMSSLGLVPALPWTPYKSEFAAAAQTDREANLARDAEYAAAVARNLPAQEFGGEPRPPATGPDLGSF